MATYARILSGQAVDVTTFDPTEAFHPDVAAQFVTVPDGTENGDLYDGKSWSKSAPATPAPAALPKLTPMTFYLAFSPAERIKIKASSNPEVMEFWDTYQRAERTDTMIDPNLVSVQEGLAYLAQQSTDTPPGAGILASKDRIAQILNGIPQ